MTDKSDDKVGHLNTILARGGGSLNDPIFKSSNARGLPGGGGGGMLKFRVDRRISERKLKSAFFLCSRLGSWSCHGISYFKHWKFIEDVDRRY